MSILPRAQITNTFFHRHYLSGTRGPLTGRSLILLAFLVYLFLGPVRHNSDIVSASLAYGLLALVILDGVYILIQALLLHSKLDISLHVPEGNVASGTPLPLMVNVSPISVWPFSYVDILLDFESPRVGHHAVRLQGRARGARRSMISITFPHRGVWAIRGVSIESGDVFGLIRHTRYEDLPYNITIVPPSIYESGFPILSSSERPGELAVDILNRQGDPFDIKPYHPSDGIKKIIWKTFAKRGELLARHPEHAMTPEGYVVIFVLAKPSDDVLCAHAIKYVAHLRSLSLDVIVGCEGQKQRSAAREEETTRTLLIESVWDTESNSLESLQGEVTQLLDECRAQAASAHLVKLVILCSGDRLALPDQKALVEGLAGWIAQRKIAPVFCITPLSDRLTARQQPIRRFTQRWLMIPNTNNQNGNQASYAAFLGACLQNQWEVHR